MFLPIYFNRGVISRLGWGFFGSLFCTIHCFFCLERQNKQFAFENHIQGGKHFKKKIIPQTTLLLNFTHPALFFLSFFVSIWLEYFMDQSNGFL